MPANRRHDPARANEIIKEGLQQGLSKNKILKSIRAEGISFDNNKFWGNAGRVTEIKQSIEKKIKVSPGSPRQEAARDNSAIIPPRKSSKKSNSGQVGQPAKKPVNSHKSKVVFKSIETPKKLSKKSDSTPKAPKGQEDYSFNIASEKGSKQYEILRQVLKDKNYKPGGSTRGIAAEYLRRIKAAGLGYRDTEAKKDVRRALSIEHSKTAEAKERSNMWFNSVYEKVKDFLKSQGKPYDKKSVNSYIDQWKKASDKMEAEAAAAISSFYFSMYGGAK